MMMKMQEVAPFQHEHSTMSSPSWSVTWWVPAVVVWAAPDGETGQQWQFGLSDILAAAEHPAERWGY